MGRNSEVKMKTSYFALMLCGLVLGGVMITAYWDDISGWVNRLSQDVVVEDEETNFRFIGKNKATLETEEDIRFYIYRLSIANLTAEELIDQDEFANYVYIESVLTLYENPNTNLYKYKVLANCTGFDYEWFDPVKGLNTIYLLNNSESITAAAMSVNALNTSLSVDTMTFDLSDNSTTNTTTYTNDREWRFFLQTLDANNESTSLEGKRSCYDFVNDTRDYIVLKITTNATTALSKWARSIDGAIADEVVASGSDIYLNFNAQVLGLFETEVRFNTALGTDYELVSYTWGYGDESNFTSII